MGQIVQAFSPKLAALYGGQSVESLDLNSLIAPHATSPYCFSISVPPKLCLEHTHEEDVELSSLEKAVPMHFSLCFCPNLHSNLCHSFQGPKSLILKCATARRCSLQLKKRQWLLHRSLCCAFVRIPWHVQSWIGLASSVTKQAIVAPREKELVILAVTAVYCDGFGEWAIPRADCERFRGRSSVWLNMFRAYCVPECARVGR